MQTEVINIKTKRNEWKRKTKQYIYIGRPTIWGNHFTHLKFLAVNGLIVVPSQGDAVIAFRDWLFGRKYKHLEQKRREKILQQIGELEGKYLGCYCEPQPCHGNVYKDMLENGFDITVNGHHYEREMSRERQLIEEDAL